MTLENGKNIRIEYIRSMLKRTNITFVRRKHSKSRDVSPEYNLAYDKPTKSVIRYRRPVSLEDNFPNNKPGKTVTFQDQIKSRKIFTMTKDQDQHRDTPGSPKRANSQTRQRPSSEVILIDREMTSPRQKPRAFERAEISKPKFGTIRKSYEPDKKFKPLEVIKAFETTAPVSENGTPVNELIRVNGMSPGSEFESEMDESVPIATFPFVEDNELEKHRKLNADAERTGQQRSPGPYDSYLKRLKLERKAQEVNKKEKEQQRAAANKKKAQFKRLQSKPRFIREVKEELEEKPTPPPTKSKEERASRILLDFKYSHAVRQFYGSHVRQSVNFSPMSDSYVDYSTGELTEVKNGCIVKTLGANVLNSRARTLPSCNPFELRMRQQIAREKAMLAKKELLEQQERDRPKPSEALRRFRKISNFRKVASFLGQAKSLDPEHTGDNTGRMSVDSQTGLPEIRVDRVENLVTRSLNSSPDGPEYMRNPVQPHAKIISLNLPTVTMDDM